MAAAHIHIIVRAELRQNPHAEDVFWRPPCFTLRAAVGSACVLVCMFQPAALNPEHLSLA